jgi:hypothetical protein
MRLRFVNRTHIKMFKPMMLYLEGLPVEPAEYRRRLAEIMRALFERYFCERSETKIRELRSIRQSARNAGDFCVAKTGDRASWELRGAAIRPSCPSG